MRTDFYDSLPNLVLKLRLFSNYCRSATSCERNSPKIKEIKSATQSTVRVGGQMRLCLCNEYEYIQVSVDEVIENLAKVRLENRQLHYLFITMIDQM